MGRSPVISILTLLENDMNDTKTIILAQAFISCMMALLMTGFFALLELGPTFEWIGSWAQHFVIAWPVAFCSSLVVGKIGFALAARMIAVCVAKSA
jgi:hypothetical protein